MDISLKNLSSTLEVEEEVILQIIKDDSFFDNWVTQDKGTYFFHSKAVDKIKESLEKQQLTLNEQLVEIPIKKIASRPKKKKNTITKAFVNDLSTDKKDSKAIRKFLLKSGSLKADEIALMSDEEVLQIFGKDYVILPKEISFIISKKALLSITDSVYILD